MKITATQYAKALYGSVENKSSQEADVLVENFAKLLQKNNQLKLADKVMEIFSTLYNADQGIVEASVVSAQALTAEARVGVENFVAKKYGAKEVVLTQSVDAKIKGGIILRVGDELMDASILKQLSNLKAVLIK